MSEEKFITDEYIKTILPQRKENSHKGTFGNVLNIAGSINYRGAAFLSTASVLKVGAGYVALASVDEVINSVSTLCPEAVFIPLKSQNGTIAAEEAEKINKLIPKFRVVEIGCGISSLDNDQTLIETFLNDLLNKIKFLDTPFILDADALNIISKLKITTLPKNCILTPHPNELSRLLGVEVSEIQLNRTKFARMAAQKYNSVVVLKGHHTVITDGNRILVNSTGNSALSKAGAGDVLSGMISGFCAQGANPFDAAVLGVYLHGLTGEIASNELTQYCVNASDLLSYMPKAVKSITI